MRDMGPEFARRVPEDRRPARPRQHRGRRPLCRAPAGRLRVPRRAHPAQDGGGVSDLHAVAAADGLSALSGADAVDGHRAVHARRRRCAALPAGRRRCRPAPSCAACSGTEDQTNCEFRTAHAIHLLPIEVAEAEYIARPGRRRGARSARAGERQGGDPAAPAHHGRRCRSRKLALERLSFYLGGPDGAAHAALRAALGARDRHRGAARRRGRCLAGPAAASRRCSRPASSEDEALLPRAPVSFDGYRLLQEYYALPERFLFFTLCWASTAPSIRCAAPDIEIIILLDRSEPALAGFGPGPHAAQLHARRSTCSRKRSDRVNLTERDAEHLVVPDRMRPLDYEVFSVTVGRGFPGGWRPDAALPALLRRQRSQPEPRPSQLLHAAPAAASCSRRARGSADRARAISGTTCSSRWSTPTSAPVPRRPAPARAGPAVHQPRPADLDAGRQEAHRLHHRGQRAGRVGPLPGRPDHAAPLPRRGRATPGASSRHLGLNYLSLTDNDRAAGRGGAARIAAALCAAERHAARARQLEGLLSVATRADRPPHSRRRSDLRRPRPAGHADHATNRRSAARAASCSPRCSTGSLPNTSRSTPSPRR